jgi:hypothetical protein
MSHLFRHGLPLIFLAGLLFLNGRSAPGAGVSPDAAMPVGKDARGTLVYKTRSATLKYAWNDYYFDLCGDRLVLTGIVEQSS